MSTPATHPQIAHHKRPSDAALVMQVAKREISTKLRDRTYLISMGAFLAILIAVIGFNVLVSGGSSQYKVAVVGTSDEQLEQAAQIQAEQMDQTVVFVEVADRAEGVAMLEDDADVVLDGTTLLGKDAVPLPLSSILQNAHQSVTALQQAQAAGIDPGELAQIMQVQPLTEQSLEASSDDAFERGMIAIIAVGLAYGMLLMIIQFVAQGVVEEKSSRVIELLMTTVRPRQLLAGKVLGLGILGFAQMLLLLGLGVAAALWLDLVEISAAGWSTIGQVLAWYVIGYAFFAVFAAAAASLVSRQEDLGSALMPLTIIPLVAFFMAFQVLTDPNGTLAVAASMIPGISPIAMPVRAAMATVPFWQYVVAVGLQLIAIYLLVRIAARIYSGAMLKTSGKLKVAEAIRRSSDEADTVPAK